MRSLPCSRRCQSLLHRRAGPAGAVRYAACAAARISPCSRCSRSPCAPRRAAHRGTPPRASCRAAQRLGVPAEGQLFLGYPDRGVSRLLTDHRATPYTSRFTDAAAVPYSAALFPAHPYTGDSLERDFGAVLERVRPTLILAPSPRDTHPDHRAAGQLTIAVTARHGLLGSIRYWIVHGGAGWPSPRRLMPGVPLTAAPRSRGLTLAVFPLDPAAEDRKLE